MRQRNLRQLSLDIQAEMKAWNKSKAMRYRPKSPLRVAHSHKFSTWDGDIYYMVEEDDNVAKDEPRNEQGEQHADQEELHIT